jgi:hypothetical protein
MEVSAVVLGLVVIVSIARAMSSSVVITVQIMFSTASQLLARFFWLWLRFPPMRLFTWRRRPGAPVARRSSERGRKVLGVLNLEG